MGAIWGAKDPAKAMDQAKEGTFNPTGIEQQGDLVKKTLSAGCSDGRFRYASDDPGRWHYAAWLPASANATPDAG